MGELRWDDITSPALRDAATGGAVVVVPVGSVEQHGPHLPLATDALCVEHLVREAAQCLAPGPAIVIAPAIRYGFSDDHLGFAGTLSISARLLEDLLTEIGSGILASGFERLVFVNGHGSNDRLLYYVVRRVKALVEKPSAVAATTYWKLALPELSALRRSSVGGMGHGCELETSLMLHYEPAFVRHDLAVREVPAAYSAYRADDLLQSGAVVAPIGSLTGPRRASRVIPCWRAPNRAICSPRPS